MKYNEDVFNSDFNSKIKNNESLLKDLVLFLIKCLNEE